MPQLIAFYFLNQLIFTIFTLIILILIMSKFILPNFVSLFVSRLYITKLSSKFLNN